MNRRSAPVGRLAPLIVTLVAAFALTITLALTLLAIPGTAVQAGTEPAAPPPTTVPAGDEPEITVNDFLPADRNLTDCVGLVERPGCGSESRGGFHQYLVAGVLFVGLAATFGRVAWIVWRSQRSHPTV